MRPRICATWIVMDPSHGQHLSQLAIQPASFFHLFSPYFHKDFAARIVLGSGHLRGWSSRDSYRHRILGSVISWRTPVTGWWPGFGELEEYFLPREIGEITGQAKVPFGDLSGEVGTKWGRARLELHQKTLGKHRHHHGKPYLWTTERHASCWSMMVRWWLIMG